MQDWKMSSKRQVYDMKYAILVPDGMADLPLEELIKNALVEI